MEQQINLERTKSICKIRKNLFCKIELFRRLKMARDLELYQSLFEFRRKGIRKTLEKWK
jgi:hypothetical protein